VPRGVRKEPGSWEKGRKLFPHLLSFQTDRLNEKGRRRQNLIDLNIFREEKASGEEASGGTLARLKWSQFSRRAVTPGLRTPLWQGGGGSRGRPKRVRNAEGGGGFFQKKGFRAVPALLTRVREDGRLSKETGSRDRGGRGLTYSINRFKGGGRNVKESKSNYTGQEKMAEETTAERQKDTPSQEIRGKGHHFLDEKEKEGHIKKKALPLSSSQLRRWRREAAFTHRKNPNCEGRGLSEK